MLEKILWKLSQAFVVLIVLSWHAHKLGGYLAV